MYYRFIILSLSLVIFAAIQAFAQVNMEKAEKAYAQADQAYDAKNFKQAGNLYAECLEAADPNSRLAQYASFNAGCAYALAKDKRKANRYASKAFDKGMFQFEDDKDYDFVRNTRKFKKLIKAVNAEIETLKSGASLIPKTYLPSKYNKEEAAPLVVLLHGYGGNPTEILEVYKPLAESKGAILMACRASEIQSRNSFFWDFENRTAIDKIRRDIEGVAKRFNVDKDKIVLSGFSQGGYLCYDFGLKNADLFKGLLPVAGSIPNEISLSPIAKKDLKLFAFVGLQESDKFLNAYENLDDQLDGLKVPYYLHYSNVGHQYPENTNDALSDAFDWLMEK